MVADLAYLVVPNASSDGRPRVSSRNGDLRRLAASFPDGCGGGPGDGAGGGRVEEDRAPAGAGRAQVPLKVKEQAEVVKLWLEQTHVHQGVPAGVQEVAAAAAETCVHPEIERQQTVERSSSLEGGKQGGR
ncbi:hypothetical protein EJB05_02417, partial [Eragrostis curvula]